MNRSSSQQLRVAILGAGNISSEHANTIRWLPNTKLIAVCDLNKESAKELSEKFDIPEVYTSSMEMLEKERPDVVHVLLPPGEHVRLSKQCLKAGSHVFVEKPIGVTTSECNDLMQVAHAAKRYVGVNHNMIYFPVVQQLIEQIRNNRFGRLTHVNIGYSMPPSKINNVAPNSFILQEPQNPILEWAVHPLSVINRLLGKVEKAETLVDGKHTISTGDYFYTTWQSSMVCERGTAQLLISVGKGYDYLWMDVLGEDAFAHVDIFNNTMIIGEYLPSRPVVAGFQTACYKSASLLRSAIKNMKNYVWSGLGLKVDAASPTQAGMRYSMRAFYDALIKEVIPPEGIEQGTAVVEYCERIFESANSTMQKELSNGKKR